MTQHDDATRLRHMLDHAHEAAEMAKGHPRRDLDTNRQLCLALTHLVEIVGEAAARVSPEGRQRWPTIPWVGIIGLRNRLIHGYDQVDLDILCSRDLWDSLLPEVRRSFAWPPSVPIEKAPHSGGASILTFWGRPQQGTTFVAHGPFLPCPTWNSTFWPSSSEA